LSNTVHKSDPLKKSCQYNIRNS